MERQWLSLYNHLKAEISAGEFPNMKVTFEQNKKLEATNGRHLVEFSISEFKPPLLRTSVLKRGRLVFEGYVQEIDEIYTIIRVTCNQ